LRAKPALPTKSQSPQNGEETVIVAADIDDPDVTTSILSTGDAL